jgi:pimeloyl-ACP methyl ester carboxylesterase
MKIVIRHGILSSAPKMGSLESYIRTAFPCASVDNQSYKWTDSILVNGVRLARDLALDAQSNPPHKQVVLIGHSMGGLVCRVANCALSDPEFYRHVRDRAHALSYWDRAEIEEARGIVGSVSVSGLVTLATPNSGAMTHGQMHAIGIVLGLVASLKLGSDGVSDLRTDHIFRVLQHCQTDVRCLTISGSYGNRFGATVRQSAYRRIAQWTAGLREPHDLIVEDQSVDLSSSILPHERGLQPTHQRRYTDCTDVTHLSIHGNPVVLQRVADFIAEVAGRCP